MSICLLPTHLYLEKCISFVSVLSIFCIIPRDPYSLKLWISSLSFSYLCSCAMSLSHVWLFGTLWTVDPRLLCPRNFSGKNIGVGCHFLLQGICLSQGSNPRLLHLLQWQADSLPLSHLGSPHFLVCWMCFSSVWFNFAHDAFRHTHVYCCFEGLSHWFESFCVKVTIFYCDSFRVF